MTKFLFILFSFGLYLVQFWLLQYPKRVLDFRTDFAPQHKFIKKFQSKRNKKNTCLPVIFSHEISRLSTASVKRLPYVGFLFIKSIFLGTSDRIPPLFLQQKKVFMRFLFFFLGGGGGVIFLFGVPVFI